jgi:hypothetical protein
MFVRDIRAATMCWLNSSAHGSVVINFCCDTRPCILAFILCWLCLHISLIFLPVTHVTTSLKHVHIIIINIKSGDQNFEESSED